METHQLAGDDQAEPEAVAAAPLLLRVAIGLRDEAVDPGGVDAVALVGDSYPDELGLVGIDEERRVRSFLEKPKDRSLLEGYEIPEALRESDEPEQTYLASMGIYVFNFAALRELLDSNDHADFGAGCRHRVAAYHDERK